MKTKPLLPPLIFAACLGFFLAPALAQAPTKSSVPETAKVLFKNDRTRVIEHHINVTP